MVGQIIVKWAENDETHKDNEHSVAHYLGEKIQEELFRRNVT